jgi:hypothetical protein
MEKARKETSIIVDYNKDIDLFYQIRDHLKREIQTNWA